MCAAVNWHSPFPGALAAAAPAAVPGAPVAGGGGARRGSNSSSSSSSSSNSSSSSSSSSSPEEEEGEGGDEGEDAAAAVDATTTVKPPEWYAAATAAEELGSPAWYLAYNAEQKAKSDAQFAAGTHWFQKEDRRRAAMTAGERKYEDEMRQEEREQFDGEGCMAPNLPGAWNQDDPASKARRLVVKLAARERRSGKIACKGGVWDALPVPPDAAALIDSFAGVGCGSAHATRCDFSS